MPNKTATHNKKQKANGQPHGQVSQPGPRGENQSLQPKVDHPYPQQRAAHTDRKKKDRPNREKDPKELRLMGWNLMFTAALVLSTMIYTYFSYHQWQSMQDALRESVATRGIENRAYFGVKNVSLSMAPAVGKQVNPTVVFINAGRTPALNVKLDLGIGLMPETVAEKLPTTINDIPSRSVVLPGETITQKTPVPPVSDQEFITKMQGGHKIYVWGTMKYDDFFGGHHTTEFCYFNDTMESLDFVVCPSHNTFN